MCKRKTTQLQSILGLKLTEVEAASVKRFHQDAHDSNFHDKRERRIEAHFQHHQARAAIHPFGDLVTAALTQPLNRRGLRSEAARITMSRVSRRGTQALLSASCITLSKYYGYRSA